MKKILKVIGLLLAVLVLAVGGGIALLTGLEYDPPATENLEIAGSAENAKTLDEKDAFSILTWNIGYCALGDNADFFMDGGEMVQSASEDRVIENMNAVSKFVKEQDADFVFIQEVDKDSKRSYGIDQTAEISGELTAYSQQTFANNFKVAYVPYPIPTIGKVDSGILTLSKYEVTDSQRISLPCPFKWPVRVANLKRCLMVDRVPVGTSGKELVLVNLHLEAFDDGEGKIAQTKVLREFMDAELAKGNYVIAGGDFNQHVSTIDTSAYPLHEDSWQPGSLDMKDFGPAWTCAMDPSSPTCRSTSLVLKGLSAAERSPENFPYFVIDGFIVSNNLEVSDVETQDLGFVNSDHNPVLMKVSFK